MMEIGTRKVVANEEDLNRDPLTGTPGAHPLGTGAGAASGAVAGSVAGLAVGGPVGGLVGAAVGAVAGGLAGKSAAELVNPTAEELFWKETFIREPYYVAGRTFEYYAPAFRRLGRPRAARWPQVRRSRTRVEIQLRPGPFRTRPDLAGSQAGRACRVEPRRTPLEGDAVAGRAQARAGGGARCSCSNSRCCCCFAPWR